MVAPLVPCVRTTNLPIQVGNKVYLQDVLVTEIEAPLVLGYDFMYKNNCLLDIRQGTLSFEDQVVQCVPEIKMPSVFKISLNETIEIPANSETITYGTFTENEPHFSTAMLEQYDMAMSKNGILLAKTVVDTNRPHHPAAICQFKQFPYQVIQKQSSSIMQ